MEFKDFPLLRLGHEIQMVGVIYADNENFYHVWLPDEPQTGEYTAKQLLMTNDDWKVFLNQTDTLEVEINTMKNGQIIKAIVRKSQRQIDQNVSWNVYRRDNYTCVYCGRNDVPLTVDHIDLWENGGRSIEENLLTCCKKCNKTRGNTPYEIWVTSDEFNKCAINTSAEQKMKLKEITLRLADLRTKRTSIIKSR